MKGKLANGMGSQYSSQYLGHMVYPALLPLMRIPRLPVVDRNDAPTNFNGLVSFAKRRNLVSARVPSHFKRSPNHDSPRKPNMLSRRDNQHTAQADCSYQATQIIPRKGTRGLRINPESSPPNFVPSRARIYVIGTKNSYSDHCE